MRLALSRGKVLALVEGLITLFSSAASAHKVVETRRAQSSAA